MITLRYHIISISAVFLSLGLGIILGGSIGQNWINEKQQTLLLSIEEKYDQAVKSNEELQEQIQELSFRIEQSNQEFSALVTNGYQSVLQGKKIGIWKPEEEPAQHIEEFLESAGLEIIWLETRMPSEVYPVIFIDGELPSWYGQIDSKMRITLHDSTLNPTEQWELLRNIQHLYKEIHHEH
ncbi:copper transporter [Ammoniphilus sp. CFH 90114]|uniref:copper transporter n=1 Tax=Ammoniphilus sp. CFH 90114 TaxID=2493665 RepID=UPI0013E9927F|nr:copper transporter [Ammoniphilus sp. CFH 90114]